MNVKVNLMEENVIQINDGTMVNANMSVSSCECIHHICEKDYVQNPVICSCENGRYLASIMFNSEIM